MCQFINFYSPLLSLGNLSPYDALYHLISDSYSGNTPPLPLHQFQGSYWFKILSPKRRKRLCVFQNIIQLTGGGRIIFSDGYELGQTRKKSDIISAVNSNIHYQKRNRLGGIPE
jgi:hypothetical protein